VVIMTMMGINYREQVQGDVDVPPGDRFLRGGDLRGADAARVGGRRMGPVAGSHHPSAPAAPRAPPPGKYAVNSLDGEDPEGLVFLLVGRRWWQVLGPVIGRVWEAGAVIMAEASGR
jgi:hypothetical protein